MQWDEVRVVVQDALDEFHRRRLKKLSELDLKSTLKKKNPYLFRAMGVNEASEIVGLILQAYMSSSEETMFGDVFFEPVAKAACGGCASDGFGADVLIETEERFTIISVKSGPNWGNSSQMKKLEDDFNSSRRRFDNRKLTKQFRVILGHCYGRKNSDPRNKNYSVRSGQAFWYELTGDADFYLKLIQLMENQPEMHRLQYEEEWSKTLNRFVREFTIDFCRQDGSVDWNKLLEFNSGSKPQYIV